MNSLLEDFAAHKDDKIQKPNFDTRMGREFLAFYLKTKFKQIINWDKKTGQNLFVSIKDDFIERFFFFWAFELELFFFLYPYCS